ncbi:MAG: hypothetical protein HY782_04415 [Chloroflexi bacterium]|nr:hypothetical protein [Chloroflexota bacterium]
MNLAHLFRNGPALPHDTVAAQRKSEHGYQIDLVVGQDGSRYVRVHKRLESNPISWVKNRVQGFLWRER